MLRVPNLVYFFGILFLSWLCLGPWIARSSYYAGILADDGIGTGWWAVFTGASLFNDLGCSHRNVKLIVGYTLTPDSMISFQQAVFPLLLGAFLIIAGFATLSRRLRIEILDSHVSFD